MTVHRQPDHITIEIYSKQTSTDTTIHLTPTHPMEHKIAACRYLINRINTLPITDINKKQEINNIIITKKNGFLTQII
jgi:hypothetical protein